MKITLQKTITWVIILILHLGVYYHTDAINPINPPDKNQTIKTTVDLVNTSNSDFENLLERKLNWKEKIGLKILRKKLKKELKKNPELSNLEPSNLFKTGCSKIVFKSGEVIEADIIQITPTEIKYKRCGKPNDPEIIVLKEEVFSVQAEDGAILYKSQAANSNTPDFYNTNSTTNSNSKPITDSLATISFIAGIAGVLLSLLLSVLVGVILSSVGLILAIISIGRIRRNPEKFSGAGLASGAIIAWFVTIIFLLLLFIL